MSISRRSLLAGGGGCVLAGAGAAAGDGGALYREWVRALALADAWAEEEARLEVRDAGPAALRRAWRMTEAAWVACDSAAERLIAEPADSLHGLLDKALCLRWRMEAQADRDMMGVLVADIRRLAARA
ncbi:hypothetical protein [Azospirillum sp.]|uniref:hypothetical protein n=1 Tax=Azospirillum sp. TaxID=34012 RepID=UPI002D5B291C|nr:hypothetical protein [Azospirillum sp.]HYD71447.1 hypothetical protein [Azospirillum sp.]